MTVPGSVLRTWLARWVSPSTLARVVDPAIADLQFELASASDGRLRRAWRHTLGIAIVVRALLVFAARRPVHAVQDLTAAEWRDVVFVAARVLLAGMVLTAAFTALPVVTMGAGLMAVPPAALVFLVPQAVPMALPAALVVAALWTRRPAMWQIHVRLALVCLAMAGAAASLMLLAEAIPVANQAFRVEGFGRPVSRGLAELTLAELWRVGLGGVAPADLMLPIDRPAASAHVHVRLALAAAPLLLTAVVLSLTSRLDRRGTVVAVAALITISYYCTMTWIAMDTPVTDARALVAWAPTGVLLALAALSRYVAARSPATNV